MTDARLLPEAPARSCDAPWTRCADACVDLQRDSAHCGACGRACGAGAACMEGGCVDARPVEVVASQSFACARTETGRVRCWGDNELLQRGDVMERPQVYPTWVSGISDAVGLSLAYNRACAVLAEGHVRCWGTGTGGPRTPVPQQVSGLTDARAVATESEATCVVRSDQTVACWGSNEQGLLGDGTTSPRSGLVPVAGLQGVTHLVAVGGSMCAWGEEGVLRCWGGGTFGHFGTPLPSPRTTPAPVEGLDDVAEICGGGRYLCARRRRGDLRCVGVSGALPTHIFPASSERWRDVVELRCNDNFACARTTDGRVFCGGGGNLWGELGRGVYGTSSPQTAVRNLLHARSLSLGANHACALDPERGIQCWGKNQRGQLGDGSELPHLRPAPVGGLPTHVREVAAGSGAMSVIDQDGVVWAWGVHSLFPRITQQRPERIPEFGFARAVGVGHRAACAVLMNGSVRCVGIGITGLLGDGVDHGETRVVGPLVLPTNAIARHVSVGHNHACAQTEAGVACWGDNASGALGDRTLSGQGPVRVANGASLRGVVVGLRFSCAFDAVGDVWCWGDLRHMQSEGPPMRAEPVRMLSFPGVVELAAGGAHLCARGGSGEVRCVGLDGLGGPLSPPGVWRVIPIRDVTSVSAGWSHTCVRRADGRVFCWGENPYGACGDGTYFERSHLVEVVGLTNAQRVFAGGDHTCALLADGTLSCWGSPVGDLTSLSRPTPVAVRW